MKDRPILFSGPMVRAIREGRKTQTRRAIKFEWCSSREALMHQAAFDPAYKCPYGKPGDRLWVRETWGMSFEDIVPTGRQFVSGGTWGSPARPNRKPCVVFRADGDMPDDSPGETATWCPSIHMPRWVSRITLEIVSVRVERLNDISEKDAIAEGVERNEGVNPWTQTDGWIKYPFDLHAEDFPAVTAKESYHSLWESINGPGSWDLNPWVWVVEFKEVKP